MSVKKALVVDDSKLARITLKKKLELRAVDVDMVESASEALNYLQSHQPDIIFMDHLMPEIDGFEATKRIKANPATRHIPVIMCTGKEHEGYLQEATAIGASNILSKPPETEALDAILTMDLVPAVAAPAAEAPAFAEPPILQPISVPPAAVATETPITADLGADAELIDDSFDADAAFGVEPETAAASDAVDLIDTSELESLSSFAAADDALSNDESLLLGVGDIDSLDQESALASLDAIADEDLLPDAAIEALVDESLSDESVAEAAAIETALEESFIDDAIVEVTPVVTPVNASVFEEAAIEAPVFEPAAFAEPSVIDLDGDEPVIVEPAFAAAHAAEPHAGESHAAAAATSSGITYQEMVSLIETEVASRAATLRETIIADLTMTIRRQLDDMRNTVGGSADLQDSRLRVLENSVAVLESSSAQKNWVLEKLPPALDMARLTDDIAARIAIVQSPELASDDLVSVRARLDEVESELVTLRKRETPVVDSTALQSLLPSLSRQLDALLQQRIPVIVSDISDQVQLQLAYQMNDGRGPGAGVAAAPSLDNIITNQADIETQLAALKKQLGDEWNARLQALVKQLKEQLQHAPSPASGSASIDTSALREQCRSDAREDIRRAFSEFKSHAGAESRSDIPAADAGRFEQMLETVTNQFARTQADYEQKLKQSRLIAIGAVVVSVAVSVALALLL